MFRNISSGQPCTRYICTLDVSYGVETAPEAPESSQNASHPAVQPAQAYFQLDVADHAGQQQDEVFLEVLNKTRQQYEAKQLAIGAVRSTTVKQLVGIGIK